MNAEGYITIDGIFIADRLEAREIVAQKFVTASNSDGASAGTTVLCREGFVINDDGECADAVDGQNASDGLTIFVDTKSVSKNSRVMVTPHVPIAVGVTEVKDGEGFEITADKLQEKDVEIDWFIVDTE